MSSTRHDEVADYAFADKARALREHGGMTQRELAALLGVSERAIQAWEAGLSYPGTERLKHLIACYLERKIFTAGREEEEAAALWTTVREKAVRYTAPFDPRWFASLRGANGPTPSLSARTSGPEPWHDWGGAPAVQMVQGRERELDTLAGWVREERSRVVQVLGAGGIGKTTLAARLAHDLAPEFTVVFWRSLRNSMPAEEWLAGAVAALSSGQATVPDGLESRLRLLQELMRSRRGLLVLDNLEAVLEPGTSELRYRAGLEGYGTVLARLAESAHQQGCLLLTSREQPLPADDPSVRALRLGGLGAEEGRALLAYRGLVGNAADWRALVEHYAGNPLALCVVGETIGGIFGGDIASFLAQDVAVFGGIRQLLDEQIGRLTALEHVIETWLAVEREPVGFAELVADLGPGVRRGDVIEAVEALRRRSLLERGAGGAFTLQPVVLEYATARLVKALAQEVLAGEPTLLVSLALIKAPAKDYVRRSQERLIAEPLLERLRASIGNAEAVERRLPALLGLWRGRPAAEQGYGPGNVINLLRLLRGDLRGLDLSDLAIRHAYLQGVEAQDTRLAGSHLSEAVLAEAFYYPTSVALSADGALLAAGTDTGDVCLWRVADRTLLAAVQGHGGPVLGVALSDDGQLLASASFDGTVRLWEAPSGRPLATLRGHTGLVWGVALSGDGQVVVSGSFDGTVRLWEAPSGRLLATMVGHTAGVLGVALSEDGHLAASGSFDGTVRLWEAPSGRLLTTLEGHAAGVRGVALSGDGRLVASGSQDGAVKLWDVDTGRLAVTLDGHTAGVLGVAVSKNGRLVASGSQDGTIKLWEAPGGRPFATLQGHTSGLEGVALSGDGRLLAGGSQDGTATLWDTFNRRQLVTLYGTTSAVWSVALSGDGRLVASGSNNGQVKLWEPATGRLLTTLEGHGSAVPGVALSEDGHLVVSGSFDGTATLWEIRSEQPLTTFKGHTAGILGVAVSGDGRLVATGSFDGTAALWEAATGRLLTTLQGHASGVQSVALSGDGRLVASGSFDGTVRLWEAPSGRLLATLNGHTGAVWSVALGGDKPLAVSAGQDGTVRLWEAPSGRLLMILLGHTRGVRGVALSADGLLLASGGYDGMVKIWDTRSGACLRTLRSDRRYERMDITGVTGVTGAQRATLLALGALERGR